MYARTAANQSATVTPTPITYAAVNMNGASSSYAYGTGFTLTNANSKIQVQADGAVRISVNIAATWASNNTRLTVSIRNNGTVVRTHTTPPLTIGAIEVVSYTHVLACNATDLLDVVISSSGDGITVQSLSLVEAHKISNVSFA